MNSEILFSVILPVYNVDKYLRECLESVRNQKYKNIQVIAINDGSTDNSEEILREYKEKYIRDMLIISQENRGLSAARNEGIKYVKGNYIYFLDSDDYISEDMFYKINLFIKSNPKIDLIKFNAESFSQDVDMYVKSEEFSSSKLYSNRNIYERESFLKLERQCYYAPVWLYCVRADVILKNKIYFLEGLIHEDELYTPLVYLHCELFGFLDEEFFHRRYRPNSIMTTSNRYKSSIDNYLIAISELEKLLNEFTEKREIEYDFIKYRISDLYYGVANLSIYNNKYRFTEVYNKLSKISLIKLKIKEIINVFK